jgi:hypothetical protein
MASLPYRVLPSRAVTLIHAYSRPLTRPDWRTIQRLTTFDLYSHVFCHLRPQTSLMKRIYYNILDTKWYNIYSVIKLFGIYIAAEQYKMTCQEILRIKGMSGAVTYHSFWGDEQ